MELIFKKFQDSLFINMNINNKQIIFINILFLLFYFWKHHKKSFFEGNFLYIYIFIYIHEHF